MTAAAPSGVVTFLFTDVEGSTRRWEADAQAMQAALVVHDKVLRTAIEAYDGFLFSHTGDGFVAAFASPMSAVNAAIDAQRELQLPVRMGLATGEAELRDGDYFGTVLNRAARVMAAGHGGQILLAESTAGLLSGVDLVDLGPRRLRDVPTPVEVFQVRAPGLRTDFPPLRAVDLTPGNLRSALTSFIGRDSELAEVQAALREHRVMTLTGVGGVGKTRLAVQVAGGMVGEFDGGVWYVDLAPIVDAENVPIIVARALGLTDQPGRSTIDTLVRFISDRRMLVVLDNCEHLLDATAELVVRLLATCRRLTLLATSREPIGVSGEVSWRVPSLSVADEAVELFADRARRVRPDFAVSDDNAAAVVTEICRRLDGLPLAIELAAARVRALSLADILDSLHDRFRLLTGGSRTAVRRQQTLRASVDW